MTETTARPLTREDITAAVVDALNTNTVSVMTSGNPNHFRLIGKSEQAARDRHPAGRAFDNPLSRDELLITASKEIADALRAGFECLDSLFGVDQSALKRADCTEEIAESESDSSFLTQILLGAIHDGIAQFGRNDKLGRNLGIAHGVESAHNSSPSVDGCGDPTVGEAGSVEDTSVSSTEKTDDPRISARYDRPLNMIAISIDGEDDVYLPRDGAFTFSDEIAQALEVQAKLGGAA